MNIPGPKEGITDILDEAIKIHLKESKREFYPLRPSSAGHCSRKLAYELMQYKKYATYTINPQEPKIYRLLNLGHSIEYSAFKNFDLCKKFDIKYKQQIVTLFSIGKDLIEGSVDGVVYTPEWKGVIDIKSSGDKFSAFYKSKWDATLEKFKTLSSLSLISDTSFYAEDLEKFLFEIKDPFLEDNFHQLNAYCCSNFFKQREVSFGSIYKYNKNDSRHYEIRFKPSEKLFQQLKEKFTFIYNTIESTKNPIDVPRDYTLGSMRCAFCPYSKQCWGDKDTLKEWFNTFPSKSWPKNINKLKNKNLLIEMFKEYQDLTEASKRKIEVEEKIIAILLNEKVNKLSLDNGYIYMVKQLKTALVLKRTKL